MKFRYRNASSKLFEFEISNNKPEKQATSSLVKANFHFYEPYGDAVVVYFNTMSFDEKFYKKKQDDKIERNCVQIDDTGPNGTSCLRPMSCRTKRKIIIFCYLSVGYFRLLLFFSLWIINTSPVLFVDLAEHCSMVHVGWVVFYAQHTFKPHRRRHRYRAQAAAATAQSNKSSKQSVVLCCTLTIDWHCNSNKDDQKWHLRHGNDTLDIAF